MPSYDRAQFVKDLEFNEGRKATVYSDSLGHKTVGVGINLDIGLYPEEIDFLRDNRIRRAERELDEHAPWWRSLSDARQRGLLDMQFNMGWGTLNEFKNLLAHLQSGNFDQAADDALHSLWASQVGARAQRIATLIRNG